MTKTMDELVADSWEREAQAWREPALVVLLPPSGEPTREEVARFFGCDVSKVCRTRSGAWTMR